MLAIELEVFGNVIPRRQQKAAGAARGIANAEGVFGRARYRTHHIHQRLNERARGEVLSRAAFHVLRILLQQALIRVAFDIGIEGSPLLAVDEVRNETAQLGRVLDFVLGFAEDNADEPLPLSQFLQRMTVMRFQIVTVQFDQGFPRKAFGNGRDAIEGRFALLIRHFEEEQKGQLLDIITIRQAVIPEDVAVVPEFLDDLLRVVGHVYLYLSFQASMGCTHLATALLRTDIVTDTYHFLIRFIESNCDPIKQVRFVVLKVSAGGIGT